MCCLVNCLAAPLHILATGNQFSSTAYSFRWYPLTSARFVKKDYRNTSSVTTMMNDLGWETLQRRRKVNRLTMMYKIVNKHVAIPPKDHIPSNTRNSRTVVCNHSAQLLVRAVDIENYRSSFFPKTILEWNNLGKELVDCQSVSSFKAAVQRSTV